MLTSNKNLVHAQLVDRTLSLMRRPAEEHHALQKALHALQMCSPCRWCDALYDKGEFDLAMSAYKETLHHLEPSYVLRRFLDAQVGCARAFNICKCGHGSIQGDAASPRAQLCATQIPGCTGRFCISTEHVHVSPASQCNVGGACTLNTCD